MNVNSEISFHAESIDFSFEHEEKVQEWLGKLASHHARTIGTLNYIFCSDEYLLQLNKEHLDHDYYTDILTFPYQDHPIISDIYISVDRVRDNAAEYGVDETQELLRVMAHGLLHLIGFDDHGEGEVARMRAAEEEALGMIDLI